MTQKPTLSPKASILLYRIAGYARRYGLNPESLRKNAASDVMDGLHLNSDSEVIELKIKGVIRNFRDSCGGTWVLTNYGVRLLAKRKNR